MESHPKNTQEKKSRPVMRILYTLSALTLLVFSLVFFFSSGFGMRDVSPQDSLADYNSAEARGIVMYLEHASTIEQCARIADVYHVTSSEEFDALSAGMDISGLKAHLINIVKEGTSDGIGIVAIVKP